MLHTKSQGHRPSGSGEEDFLRVFTIYGRGGHLGHVTKTIWTNFRSPILRSLHMKYEFNWPSSFRGEDVWKCWRTTDGRTTDAGVTGILLAHQWAFGSGELKTLNKTIIADDLNTHLTVHHVIVWTLIRCQLPVATLFAKSLRCVNRTRPNKRNHDHHAWLLDFESWRVI